MKNIALVVLLLPLAAHATDDPLAHVPLKAKTFNCSPLKIHDGDTLTIHMSVPHPQELAILSPDNSYHYLWHSDRSMEELVKFTKTPVVRLSTQTARASSSEQELLFNLAGWYTVQLSNNLERENYPGTLNECRVYFSGRRVTSQARPNNSFKPTPHRGVGHVPALR
jgi:hypothetical protein